ncbi:MAG: beta-lactamase family protein [Ferrimicrobium sp.]|jgi:CubicO group peptidase (beta-lactamase class C family)|nr:beta-lactamase family protein [Ferrimicrobium sp.]
MSELQHPNPFGGADDLAASPVGPLLASSAVAIDDLFLRFLEIHPTPGLAWGLVDRAGLVHTGAHGYADVSAKASASGHHVFRIASMTKSFTALSVLSLRDANKLHLDDPAQHWLAELQICEGLDDDSSPITIRQLLSMAAGLVEDDPWADRQLSMSEHSFGELLAAGIGLDLAPSSAFEYSNLGYAMLGAILKRASGYDLGSFATEHILGPLQMSATTWNLPEVDPRVLAKGYSLKSDQWLPEPLLHDGAFGAMGGLASTIEDLARWVSLHLNAWPVGTHAVPSELFGIKASTLREMATVHTVMAHPRNEQPGVVAQGYGYGLMIAHHQQLGRIVGHSGGLPGFGSRMEWLPDYGVGLIALANRTYTPLTDVVRQGLTYLVDKGFVSTEPHVVSDDLHRVYDAIIMTYEQPEQTQTLYDVALPTYFLDRDDDRRPPNFAALRARYGPLIAPAPLVATGLLRGSWSMPCEAGTFTVEAMLGPIKPHKLQFLRVTEEPQQG